MTLALCFATWASPFKKGTESLVPSAQAHFGVEVTGQVDWEFVRTMMGTDLTIIQDLPLAGNGHVDVELSVFSPFAPGCKIVEMTDSGPVEHPVPTSRRYFSARVLGSSKGFGLFTFEGEDFSGFISVDNGLYIYGVTPGPQGERLAASSKFDPSLQPERYHQCENDQLAVQAPLGDRPLPANFAMNLSTTPLQANLAIEMDFESYTYFHTVPASVQYAADLLAAMSVIYQADIQTTLGAVNVRVWSTSNDPYRSGTGTSGLLDDLKAEYVAHMGSINRATAMLMSRRSMGGIAWVDALCSKNYGYAVCGIDGSHTYPTSAWTWDANCTTHELGHNFKSHHTHCYGTNVGLPDWIDKCYNGEGGCFSGAVVNPPMSEKTIMSYCHLLSPGEVTLTFVDRYTGTDGLPGYTRSLIRAGAEAASACLAAPTCAFTCTPSSDVSFAAPPATVNFFGSPVAASCAGSPTWSWAFGDGGTSTQQNPSHLYPSAGTYHWTVTGTLNGQTCTGAGSVQVTPCTVTCTATVPTTAIVGWPITFSSTASAGPTCVGTVQYDWDFGDGSAHSTQASPNHAYSSAGTYPWILTATVGTTTCVKTGNIIITPACALTCNATVPTTGQTGTVVYFQGSGTATNCSGTITYTWNFGDGSTGSGQGINHTYAAAGNYHWTLQVKVGTTTCGKEGDIVISAAPPPCTLTCTAGAAPSSGTAPLEVAFTATATATNCTGTPSYAWVFGDGATSSEQNPAHTYAAAGSYPWTLTVTVDGKTCTQSGTVTVAVPCTLTCSASAEPSSGPAPLSVTFTATAIPDHCTGSPSYAWTFGDGDTSATQNSSHNYATPGTYDWTLTATVDGKTCAQAGTIIVGEPCALTCTATAPGTGVAGVPVSFQSTATATHCTGDPTYTWAFGDGATSSEQNPSHTYGAGSFTWTLTVAIEDKTCTQTGTVVVSEPCALACTASATPAAGVAPLEVVFAATATATNCTGTPTFAWVFGDGGTSSEQNPSHTYAAPGSYPWTLTATVEGRNCTQAGTVTVAAPCTLSCEASAAPDHGNAPLQVAFTSTVTPENCAGAPSYAWTFGDGATSAEANPSHTYAAAGSFIWTLTVTVDGKTCTRTGSVTVEPGIPGDANNDGVVSIGEVQQAINMFLGTQPPGNGVDCNGDGTVSIGEVQKVINAFLGISSSC
jgi:PKD repeat protein